MLDGIWSKLINIWCHFLFQTYTVKDRAEVEKFSPSAKEIHKYYDPNVYQFVVLKTKLESLREKVTTDSSEKKKKNNFLHMHYNSESLNPHEQVDSSLVALQESPSYQFKDTSDLLKAARKNLFSYHDKILYCLDNLGLVCACEVQSNFLYYYFFIISLRYLPIIIGVE